MNDRFKRKDGKRIYDSERERATRFFRGHIFTPKNPRGRIVRLLCQFCKPNEQTSISQFHHPDYKRPFFGVWCCESHHRQIDHGSLIVHPSKWCDYASLVENILRPGASVTLRALAAGLRVVPSQDTPF